MRRSDTRRDVKVIVAMILSLLIPAVITLVTVNETVRNAISANNPTPWGYTLSLSLFLVPILVIGTAHIRLLEEQVAKKAMWASAALIALLGTVLDLAFGYHFFSFPNPLATLELRLPAWNWGTMAPEWGYLPIEEFAFYILGGIFLITTYVWADSDWLRDYDPQDYHDTAHKHPKLIDFSWWNLLGGVVLIGLAILYKKFGPHDYRDGFPGYFVFLTVLGLVPLSAVFRAVRPFINWRAFTFSYGVLLLVSLMWEATLGVPYEWWTYKPYQMVGIFVTAWSTLPIEAVLLWTVAMFGSVIAYEFFRIYFHMERDKMRHALLGLPGDNGSPTAPNASPNPRDE